MDQHLPECDFAIFAKAHASAAGHADCDCTCCCAALRVLAERLAGDRDEAVGLAAFHAYRTGLVDGLAMAIDVTTQSWQSHPETDWDEATVALQQAIEDAKENLEAAHGSTQTAVPGDTSPASTTPEHVADSHHEGAGK